jgi:Leucine-rich repeat (LRR) protein
MEENELQDLTNLTFKCQNVLEVSLSSNILATVPTFVRNCQNVRKMDFSGNRIDSFDNETFSQLENLVEMSFKFLSSSLTLRQNKLGHLSVAIFDL